MSRDSAKKEEPAFPKGVAKPAQRALAAAGYTRLDQLTTARECDLKKLDGMVPRRCGS